MLCMMELLHDWTMCLHFLFSCFGLASTEQWKSTLRAFSRIECEWEGPSGETLLARELKREKACNEAQLEPLKDTLRKYGCTMLCDGCRSYSYRDIHLEASTRGHHGH
eukprot:c33774_g1_i1 orf=201-524(+)